MAQPGDKRVARRGKNGICTVVPGATSRSGASSHTPILPSHRPLGKCFKLISPHSEIALHYLFSSGGSTNRKSKYKRRAGSWGTWFSMGSPGLSAFNLFMIKCLFWRQYQNTWLNRSSNPPRVRSFPRPSFRLFVVAINCPCKVMRTAPATPWACRLPLHSALKSFALPYER